MRCICCNRNLNDSESTRRLVSTGDFLDMCNTCYSDIASVVPTISRPDLNPSEPIEDWEEEYWKEDKWDDS